MRQRYGLETTILAILSEERDDQRCTVTSLRLLENHLPDMILPDTLRWAAVDELATLTFDTEGQRLATAATLRELLTDAVPAARTAWERPGWYRRAAEWISATLATLGYQQTGPVEQVKTWFLSCVLRVPTDQGLVYFKALIDVPELANEALVTAPLARLFPLEVPAPLLVDAERRWMLSPDLGPPMSDLGLTSPAAARARMQAAFARLQQAAAPHCAELLASGWPDWRLPRLAAELEVLLSDGALADIDPEQQQALRAAAPRLKTICERLAGANIPPSIGHGDLHLANVVQRGEKYCFFDWDSASITHPFLDQVDIYHEVDLSVQQQLRDSYLEQWRDYEPMDRLVALWMLARPLYTLKQAITYRYLIQQIEPRARPELAWAVPFWIGQTLAALNDSLDAQQQV